MILKRFLNDDQKGLHSSKRFLLQGSKGFLHQGSKGCLNQGYKKYLTKLVQGIINELFLFRML